MSASCPMARRLLATLGVAAILGAGPAPATAQRAPDQTAPLQGRTRTASPQALPQPMSATDAARMRRAFEAQGRGDFAEAARQAGELDDGRLLGHLHADRILRGQGGAAEMQAWLADFSDHPDAPAIHERLVERLPRGASAPPPPQNPDPPSLSEILEELPPVPDSFARNPALDRTVAARVAEGNVAAALSLLGRTRGLSAAYAAQLKAEMSQALFRQGRDEEALRLAQAALRRAPGNPLAAFQLGLAAWGLERWETAFHAFERAARAEAAAPALRASAAYWTARAAVRARRPSQYVPWMLQAAQEPRTFHGMVARRTLGLPPGLVWERDVANESHAAALAETAGGWRALALLQVGQEARAEAELRLLHRRARNNPQVVQAILVAGQRAGLASVTALVANASASGRDRDLARFPLPRLAPPGGFRIDPALLYAIALQESRFDPQAVSPAGARGLLQIMPATASYVANDPTLRGASVGRLHEPGFSLEIGQRYIHYLARHEAVRGNLVRLLAAYNAGPGNLQRWLPASGHRDDPLLFIESIPIHETRLYVQRVLTFSWIYANRLGLPSPSLDAIAGGHFPTFAEPDEVTAMLRVRPVRAR